MHVYVLFCVALPRAPKYLRVDSVGSTWLMIMWGPLLSPPPNPPHDNFTVQNVSGDMFFNRTVPADDFSLNLTGLLPDTEYSLRVMAVSPIGQGEAAINSTRTLRGAATSLLTVHVM